MLISYNNKTSQGKELSIYTLGLDWDKLSIVPYNSLWPSIFNAESKRILKKLSPWLEKLEHIGSTSVPNLSAKPIVDIIGTVSSVDSLYDKILNFHELGYNYLGECGRPGRYFFTYNRATVTYFHLHIVSGKSGYWHKLVSFRDKLRTDKEIKSRYMQHKQNLNVICGNNRKMYRKEKEKWFDINNFQ